GASSSSERRVTPSRIESLRAGVSSLPPFVTSMRFMPPSSSMYLFSSASVNSTCWHPLAAASFVGTSEDAELPPHLAGRVRPPPGRWAHGVRADAGEDRHGRRAGYAVVDLVAGPHTEEPLGGDHERTQVQARLIGFRLRRRNPGLVDGDQRLERIDEVLLRQLRQREAFGRPI